MKANAMTAPSAARGVAAAPAGSGALAGHLAQLVSVTTWASGLVVLKSAVEVFEFSHLVLMQVAGAALIMWPIVLVAFRPRLDARRVLKGLAFGAVTPGCAMMLNAAGASLTDAVSLGVIWGLFPLMVPLLGRALLGERVSGLLYAGAVVGFGGVVALVTQRQGGDGASLVGDLLVFAAIVCSALGQILGRYINRGEPQPLVTAALQVTGALPVAGLAALVLAAGPIGLTAAPGRALAEVAWLVLVPTVVNFFAYNIALSRLPVGWISLYVCLVPAVSTVLAALYLGAAVGPWEVAAIGVIVAGVALPSAERVRRARRDAAAMASGGSGGR